MPDTISDAESTSSLHVNVASNSLAAELHKITELVKQLDDFRPEVKKKPGRPRATPANNKPSKSGTSENTSPSIATPLFSLCNLTQKILQKLDQVQEENQQLRSMIENLQLERRGPEQDGIAEDGAQAENSRSYAAVTRQNIAANSKTINKFDSRYRPDRTGRFLNHPKTRWRLRQ